jgi:hypothetical protein
VTAPPRERAAPGPDADLAHPDRSSLHRFFHAPDVPEAVRAADDALAVELYPWAYALVTPGATAVEAADRRAGLGERDMSRAPLREATAYTASADVTVMVVPGAAHCFNLASNRRQFFERFAGWAQSVARSAP